MAAVSKGAPTRLSWARTLSAEGVGEQSGGLRAGHVIGDRYLAVRRLGEGGMGMVWEAVHQQLGRRVALKLLRGERPADLSDVTLMRFRREARTAAAIEHPNIVRILDYGADRAHGPFLVMELLEGESLADATSSAEPMSLSQALEWLLPVASALDALHGHGLVHRDIKPENIVRARAYGQETVKLVDFGLAAHVDGRDRLTREGAVLGTPHYMAPEVAAGDVATTPSDIYSLGVVLFELLTGSLPHSGDTLLSILTAKLTTPAPSLSQRSGKMFTVQVELALQRALDQDPTARHSTATAMIQSLTRRSRWSEGRSS